MLTSYYLKRLLKFWINYMKLNKNFCLFFLLTKSKNDNSNKPYNFNYYLSVLYFYLSYDEIIEKDMSLSYK
ncbi:hypothetical protein BpHYR1_032512 [Brachionus plicatilis]|uniref:Uncharacterized protein n=1 Tax=Brachionus plicatilis TaxID=10195 RepID=A0A3M7Q4U5_BRAPC|nr:hypothetical protein BpHYR1_032512 [Brachionus plicatilis]